MYGIDISNNNAGLVLEHVYKIGFVICKATEGTSFIDKYAQSFVSDARKLGRKIGLYHFARPDKHNSIKAMQEEADLFVRQVKALNCLGEAILCLDWEVEPLNNTDLIHAFCQRVEDITGVRVVLYTSESVVMEWKRIGIWDSEGLSKYPLWVAKWPTGKPMEPATNIDAVPGTVNSTIPWVIWQYAASGVISGYKGQIDLDYTHLSADDWTRLAKPYGTSTVYIDSVPDVVPETISQDMQWAIDNGIFKGYNGKYFPDRPLTRNEAAIVLKRLYEFLVQNPDTEYYP